MSVGVCALEQLAEVGLGFKSLQNEFFYVDDRELGTLKIETRYLRPIWRLRDFAKNTFVQTGRPAKKLFYCQDTEVDLRGTRALTYIRGMAGRPAAARKQSGAASSIRQALEAQGSGLWYAPKAQMHPSHIWLRKAFAGVFSPFLFDEPTVADQRCNYIIPKEGIYWNELAAVTTSSVFALALECEGGAAMGGGALEVATTQLRQVPVLDLRRLGRADLEEVVTLAKRVWTQERPIDWLKQPELGEGMTALDSFVLDPPCANDL